MKLLFIINGEAVRVEGRTCEAIGSIRDTALKQSRNTGRPPEEWEIRKETGHLLDPAAELWELGLGDRPRLFLSLKIGFGG